MNEGDNCAFPFVVPGGGSQERGLTKRELFALIAMHAVMTADKEERSTVDVAEIAFNYADAMIAESRS